MAATKMQVQLKVGSCVASVLENVNKRSDSEIRHWIEDAIAAARASERDARKASQCVDS